MAPETSSGADLGGPAPAWILRASAVAALVVGSIMLVAGIELVLTMHDLATPVDGWALAEPETSWIAAGLVGLLLFLPVMWLWASVQALRRRRPARTRKGRARANDRHHGRARETDASGHRPAPTSSRQDHEEHQRRRRLGAFSPSLCALCALCGLCVLVHARSAFVNAEGAEGAETAEADTVLVPLNGGHGRRP